MMRTTTLQKLAAAVAIVTTGVWLAPVAAQVRGGRRTATVHGEEGRAAAAGPRGVAVKGEEGYAAAGRHGAVAKGDEGYAAVGRHGAVAQTEDGYARAGPRGAVVAGEEGYQAVGRHGVVVGNNYESYEAWRAVAGVGVGIAIGTMLAKPPAAAAPVVVEGANYYYADGTYYTRVMSNGTMVYQVVAPPAGAIITTLPAGCQSVRVGNATYSQCGGVHYERVSNGYRVVVL